MDRRDRIAMYGKGPFDFDARSMTFSIEVEPEDDDAELMDVLTIPARYEVCQTCQGKGTHVNPSIDAHGIGAEEWENDWDEDERDDYLDGRYDVPCYECEGRNVSPVPDLANVDEATRKRVEGILASFADSIRESEAERRMGA